MSDLVINGGLIALVFMVVGATWGLAAFMSKMKDGFLKALQLQADTLTAKLAAQEMTHQARVTQLERDHNEALRTTRNDFATVAEAIRQKVNQFEIWSRDEFVRKASFEPIISRLEKGIENLGTKIETRLDKMADRIERIGHDGT